MAIDDKSIPGIPIPDLERRKFYDDGEVSYVRTIQAAEEINDISTEQLILKALENMLHEMKTTNLYLEQIVGENLGGGCG